jgi:hypothetical protein
MLLPQPSNLACPPRLPIMLRPIRAGSACEGAVWMVPCEGAGNTLQRHVTRVRVFALLPRSHYPAPTTPAPFPRPAALSLLFCSARASPRSLRPSHSLIFPPAPMSLSVNVFNHDSLRSTRAALASAGFVGRHSSLRLLASPSRFAFSLRLLAPLVSSASTLCARFTRPLVNLARSARSRRRR